MKAAIRDAARRLATYMRPVLRQTLSRLALPWTARDGPPASNGGKPVRDPLFQPWPSAIDGRTLRWSFDVGPALRRVYRSGVEGLPQPFAHRFSSAWATYCGARYSLLVGHGTDALRLALAAGLDHDGLDYGGEVIVPNLSFIASATSALDRRFGVALVDVDPATLLLDPERVEEAVVPGKTKAIMAVHLFGQPADMTRLRAIAQRHGLLLVEDAAQAHGAAWQGQRVGSLGDIGGFSFQSSKVLSAGEGGAIVTNDEHIFERLHSLHNVGRSLVGTSRWEHHTLGWNCRITEYQAALLLTRLRHFDELQRRRSRNFGLLRELLNESTSLTPLATSPGVSAHGMYMFVMKYAADSCGGAHVDTFVSAVRAEGIPLFRGFSATIAQQPAIRHLVARRPDYVRLCETPVADRAVGEIVYFPHEVFLGRARDIYDIAAAVRKIERAFRSA